MTTTNNTCNGLGDRLKEMFLGKPLREQWRMEDPGDLAPISRQEAVFCRSEWMSPLQEKVANILISRSVALDEEARKVWNQLKVPRRTLLAHSKPVKWGDGDIKLDENGDPMLSDEIPF